MTPCTKSGFNAAGEPLFRWPFGRRHITGCQIAEFLGGGHTIFNIALWHCGVTGSIDAAALRTTLTHLAHRADLVRLRHQPPTWNGSTNLFAFLAHPHAVNCGLSRALSEDFGALFVHIPIPPRARKCKGKNARWPNSAPSASNG